MRKFKQNVPLIIFQVLVLAGLFAFPGAAFPQAQTTDQELRLLALEEKAGAIVAVQEWLDRVSFKGDLRLRHESQFRDDPLFDRHRQRIRLRLGATFHLYKDLDVAFRISSGDTGDPTDPVSTNATLKNSFEKKPLTLDRAYAQWRPGPFTLTGGKMPNPFMRTQVVWDSDINPEGAAESFKYKFLDHTTLFVNAAQFVLDENNSSSGSGPNADPWVLGFQVGVEQGLGSLGKAKLAFAYYDFLDLQGEVVAFAQGGNTKGPGGVLGNDFNVIDIIGELYFDFAVPIVLQAEYINNTAAENTGSDDYDDAFLVGVVINKNVNKFMDWQARYSYRVVEADAVLDALNNSDFHGGGTNARGHELGLNVGIRKGVSFAFTYYITTIESGEKTASSDRDRMQLDLKFKFK